MTLSVDEGVHLDSRNPGLDGTIGRPIRSAFSLSPDEQNLVYVGYQEGADPQLYLRPLDQGQAHPIPGTEGARVASFSSDGQSAFQLPGTLVYLTGGLMPLQATRLNWVDLDGSVEPFATQPRRDNTQPPTRYSHARFSPDGARLAYTNESDRIDRSTWVYDMSPECGSAGTDLARTRVVRLESGGHRDCVCRKAWRRSDESVSDGGGRQRSTGSFNRKRCGSRTVVVVAGRCWWRLWNPATS